MIKVKFRRFVARYFGWLVEWAYALKIRAMKLKDPIIILTPGKVGSSSVYYTLKKELKNPVFHIHQLSEKGISDSIDEHLKSDRRSKPLHLIVSGLLRKNLSTHKGDIYIITIIREPVSREISAFFQNTDFFKSVIEDNQLNIDKNKALELLGNRFDGDIMKPLEMWFDREIKGNFGIDILEIENLEKEYWISDKGRYHHLLMKMETLDEVFSEAVQELLQLPSPVVLKNANIAENKHYAKAYHSVKKDINIPEARLEEIVASRYFQKFYHKETSRVMKRWSHD